MQITCNYDQKWQLMSTNQDLKPPVTPEGFLSTWLVPKVLWLQNLGVMKQICQL